MLKTVTETKYYSVMDNPIELPTLEQILSIIIQPEDNFTIEFEYNVKYPRSFTSPLGHGWDRKSLFQTVFKDNKHSDYQLTGQEKVTNILFFIDDEDIEDSKYFITIRTDIKD